MGTYALNVTLDFSAAHCLRGYEGKCSRVHGHNYRVQAEIASSELNTLGIAIDYFDVKRLLSSLVKQLDHYNINDIPPFDTINPTAENIAQWFFQQLKHNLHNHPEPVRLTAVTLWESDDFSVRYSENEY